MSDSTLIRLRHHAKDERNTTFARATMRDAEQEIERLRDELAASREREARMREAGQRLLDAIEHDTQIHRFSILWDGLRAALAEGAQK